MPSPNLAITGCFFFSTTGAMGSSMCKYFWTFSALVADAGNLIPAPFSSSSNCSSESFATLSSKRCRISFSVSL
eukprot:Skav206001  [mRNA]  locus=scaffold2084:421338:424529:+ [translate_table: standard]